MTRIKNRDLRSVSSAAKVVLKAHDVVFAEISSSLHLDKDQVLVAGILDTVRGPDGNVDRFPRVHDDLFIVERDLCGSGDDEPVFGTLRVLLIAESLTRQHVDAFHFERARFLEHRVASPWAAIKLSQDRLLLEWVERTLAHKKTQRLIAEPLCLLCRCDEDYEPGRNVT